MDWLSAGSCSAASISREHRAASYSAAALALARPLAQEKSFHRSLAFDFDAAARFEIKPIVQQSARRCRDLDATGQGVGFHAACGIHRIAPDVVGEFVGADDAGNDRTRVNADPGLELQAGCRGDRLHLVEHAQRQRGNTHRMIGLRFGNSCRHHVGVADGLDLFHPLLGGQAIEA